VLTVGPYEISPLRAEDAPALAAAYERNREHLRPWDPVRPPAFFSVEGQQARVSAELEAVARGQLAVWLIRSGETVVGRVALNNVVMAAFRSAAVGYWVDAAHTRRGLATRAVEHACAEALRLGLHRVEAGTVVDNVASQMVLRRCGFEPFGTAPQYLWIAGTWRDHHLFQRILHDGAPY
jgi:ribosomal-protein-alanine N-acetyltransferase